MKKTTEAQEQEALMHLSAFHPLLKNVIYAIPNDGIRTAAQGANFKRRGLRPGMPDVCVPIARAPYSALYIELKRNDKRIKPTKAQIECHAHLRRAGNAVYVAWGWTQAWDIIEDYLRQSSNLLQV